MSTELQERQEVIRRYLAGEGASAIGRSMNKSHQWVGYWIKRYKPDDVVGSLSNRSRRPHHPHSKWDACVREMVVRSRTLRESQPYALVSAEAIHYELRELGVSPLPPVRTIHAWLKQAGRIGKRATPAPLPEGNPTYPAPVREAVNDLHELDLKGPLYLQDQSQKYYLVALRDFASKRVALGVLTSRQADPITAFLVEAWRKIGVPRTLQLDNGMEFRGSNRYPRSFGKVVRLCTHLSVEPTFIPPREPWRNGLIENLNGQVNRLLLQARRFASLADLQQAVAECETAINSTHRLPALEGKTPNETAARATLRTLPDTFVPNQATWSLDSGSVAFVRLIRKSGRITLFADDKLDIDPALHKHYVLARLTFPSRQLQVFSHTKTLLKSFSF